MKSEGKLGELVMGWCFLLMGCGLLGVALLFLQRGYLPARFGGRIEAGTLSFAIIELVIVGVGAMCLVVGRQAARRALSGRG